MTVVRPFCSDDLEAVARLYEDVRWQGRRDARPGLVAWLREVLEHPWVDPEIPSLVATGPDGEVVGFLASHVRRLVADGRPVRMGCSGHLVVAEHARSRGTGARLTATYLRGAQDLSVTDAATGTMAQIWEGLGGDVAPLQQFSWVRAVAPWRHPRRLAETAWSRVGGRTLDPVDAGRLPPLARVLDSGARVTPLTPDGLLGVLPTLTTRLRLFPAYDAAFLGWMFAQLASSGPGALRAGAVHAATGRPLGYFVYWARPGGLCPVAAVVAADATTSGQVLQAMLADARGCGVAALTGRIEPRAAAGLSTGRTVLRLGNCRALVHARDARLLYLATSRHALLTRMEGESWWMPPSPGRAVTLVPRAPDVPVPRPRRAAVG